MKSVFRSRSTSSTLAAVLFFSAFSLFGATTPPALAQSFPNLAFPAGPTRTLTKSVSVPGSVPVIATIRLRRNGSNNEFADKRFQVRLLRPNGSQADSEQVNVGSVNKSVSLNGAKTGDNVCGNWTVEITNPGDAASGATATITIVFVVIATPQIQTLTAFEISKGSQNYVDRSISVLGPGRLTITATWFTLDYPPYSLQFTLYRNNSSVASDKGYAQHTPLTSSNQRMKITYDVTDSSGSWKVRAYGSSRGKVMNIKITKVLVPGCN